MIIETAEEKRERIFGFYKRDLIELTANNTRPIRFNCIEYACRFPKINPFEMAKALKNDGYDLVFDDSSISQKENDRKRKAVEKFGKN